MTPAMLQTARSWADAVDNVELRAGFAEALPVEDGWADVVISNGMLNLAPNKLAVLAEVFRVLRPGGVLAIADIVVPRPIKEDDRRNIDLWKG
jgi:ubiquinone/menaquinone biosynthesis C-methylase UbiE